MTEPVDLTAKLEAGDTRPEVLDLVKNLKAAMPDLKKLLSDVNDHWTYEDGLYRFYHQSFKVYGLQAMTIKIVSLLEKLVPKADLERKKARFWAYSERTGEPSSLLHPWFMKVVKDGTGKTWKREDNKNWLEVTRPIVEAFLHAKYFLEMAVKYGEELGDVPPNWLPSGWASFLYLYDLR